MSNTERQRRFRKRHPGYYARIRARERASMREARARFVAESLAAGAARIAAEEAAKRTPLMLPAPVEACMIEGLNAIPASALVRESAPIAAQR